MWLLLGFITLCNAIPFPGYELMCFFTFASIFTQNKIKETSFESGSVLPSVVLLTKDALLTGLHDTQHKDRVTLSQASYLLLLC
jgi:hypothetical protein